MDKKLKEAIDKGRSAKEKKVSTERAILEEKQAQHKKYINSHLPAAKKWINDVLFARIAQKEAENINYISRSIYLGSGTQDGIPVESIYEAAKKVKGLLPTYECPAIYESGECVGVSEPIYSIKWESIDPNDNRNDR